MFRNEEISNIFTKPVFYVDHMKHLTEKEIKKSWEKSQENVVIKRLLRGNDLSKIMQSLDGFQEAFKEELRILICSDERVPDEEKRGKIGIAGVGILVPDEDLEKFVEDNLWLPEKITSHDDCGAAAKKLGALKEQDAIPGGVETVEDLAIWHARRLVSMFNEARAKANPERAAREIVEYEHIPKKQMQGELHNARAICFDGTGKFDKNKMPDMPNAFTCSGPGLGLSKKYSIDELATLTGIALSDHGFEDKFNANNPFYIFVSAYDEKRLMELTGWAEEAVKKFEDRVAVKGYLAPVG